MGHIIGRADADGWSANVTQDAAGFLQFGPYATQLGAGTHVAKWALMIDNNSIDDLRPSLHARCFPCRPPA